jgi:alpha-mannosidase
MATDLLEQILPHIEASIYPQIISIPDWKIKEHKDQVLLSTTSKDQKGTLIRIPFEWGKSHKAMWFKQLVRIPDSFAGNYVALQVDLYSGTVWIDNHFCHSISPRQKEFPLTYSAKAQEEFFVSILAEPNPAQNTQLFSKAELITVDIFARKLYNSLVMLQDVENTFDPHSSEAKQLHDLIHRTLIFLKYYKPGSEEYPNAIRRAYDFLQKTIESECKATIPSNFNVNLFSSDVLDRIPQQLPFQHLRATANIFRNCNEHPQISVSAVGTTRFHYVEDQIPGDFPRIKELVNQQRIELVGNALAMADYRIHTHEALVRRFLLEHHYYQQKFEQSPKIFYLSSPSSAIPSLPQILHNFGYECVIMTTESESEDIPLHSVLYWCGLDGTTLMTAVLPKHHTIELGSHDFLAEIETIPENNSDQEQQILQLYDNDSAYPSHIEKISAIRSLPGLPKITFSTISRFFDTLRAGDEQQIHYPKKITIGSLSAISTYPLHLLKDFRNLEQLIPKAELFATLAYVNTQNVSSRKHQQNLLNESWRKLLCTLFTEYTSNSATAEMYTQLRKEFTALQETCQQSIDYSCSRFLVKTSKKEREQLFAVVNPSAWMRSDYITLTVKTDDFYPVVTTNDGDPVETQVISTEHGVTTLLCFIKDVPAFSSITLKVLTAPLQPDIQTPWLVSYRSIETPWYRIRFDGNGSISSLYAKHLNKELVSKGKKFNLISVVRELKKIEVDDQDSSPAFQKLEVKLKNLKIIENGPLRAIIRLDYHSQSQSTIHGEIVLYHATPRIDFQVTLRCKERHLNISTSFHLNTTPKKISLEIPFGSHSFSFDPKETSPIVTNKWMALQETSEGLCFLSSLPSEYSINRGAVSLKLLQTHSIPRHSKATKDIDLSFYNIGEQTCSYAFYPKKGEWKAWEAHRAAEEYCTNFLVIPHASLSLDEPIVAINKNSIIITALKFSETDDHIILRCFESDGKSTDTVFKFGIPVKSIEECLMTEAPTKTLTVNNNQCRVRFKPFEIKTLKIAFTHQAKRKKKK